MRRFDPATGDLLRALLFLPLAVLATLGLLGHWFGWRDAWILADWSIVGLAGLVWRSPKALIVPAAASLAVALAALSGVWPDDSARLAVQLVVGAFFFTVLGIAAGLALGAFSSALRGGRVALLGRKQVLAELATLAILAIALTPMAFGSFGPRTTLAVVGLVVAPLAVGGIAAVRQPRHCWLVALETWLASLAPQVVAVIWFPTGVQEPLALVLLESLVAIVPVAWGVALLGKWLGAAARRAREPGNTAA